jgi:hypothetical protein
MVVMTDTAVNVRRVSEIAGEVLLGCLYLMAVIAERDGNGYLAYALYEAILASMLEVYDSTDDPKRCALPPLHTRARALPACFVKMGPLPHPCLPVRARAVHRRLRWSCGRAWRGCCSDRGRARKLRSTGKHCRSCC